MTACQYVVMLPIPLDLRSGHTPSAQSDDGRIGPCHSEVERSYASIDTSRRKDVGIPRVPVDIGDGAEVSVNDAMQRTGRRC